MELLACMFFLVMVWLVVWPILFLVRLKSVENMVRTLGSEMKKTGPTVPASQAGTTRNPDEVPEPPSDIPVRKPEIVAEARLANPERIDNAPPPSPTIPAPKRPHPPRQPSAFEAAAFNALRKMRNWLFIGMESLPEGTSWEFALASQWLLRIGVLILLMGIGFFAKISIENEWIGPLGQVLLIAMAGMGLLVGGSNLLGGTYHLMGQGLQGAGLVTLYFAVFAAHGLFHVIDTLSSFALMAAITALATLLAVRFRSLLVAVIGVLGGYATPVFMGGAPVNYPGLLGYMVVLGLGVLGVSWWRKWHLLQLLALACDLILFQASLAHYTDQDFSVVMPFAAARFLLFSTMAFMHNLVRRERSNLLDLLALAVNAWAFFLNAQWMIGHVWGIEAAAGLCLILAFFYAAHVLLFLRLQVVDRELLTGFLGLSSLFLAVAIPMLLSNRWLTTSWALQALAMAWVAQQLGSRVLGQITMLLLVVVIGRYAMIDLPRHAVETIQTDIPLLEFLGQSAGRLAEFAIPAVSVITASWLLARLPRENLHITPDNDYPEFVPSGTFSSWMIPLIVLIMFPFLYLETGRQLRFWVEPAWPSGLTLLVVATAVGIFSSTRQGYSPKLIIPFMGLVATLLVGKLVVIDLVGFWGYRPDSSCVFHGPYSTIQTLSRLADFGLIVAWLIWLGWMLSVSSSSSRAGTVFSILAMMLSLLHARLETIHILHYFEMDGLAEGAVSIAWSLYALAALLVGLICNHKPARVCSLSLFAVIAAKVFINDLAALDQVYKVAAFTILGGLLLVGAFLYLKFQSLGQNPNTLGKQT